MHVYIRLSPFLNRCYIDTMMPCWFLSDILQTQSGSTSVCSPHIRNIREFVILSERNKLSTTNFKLKFTKAINKEFPLNGSSIKHADLIHLTPKDSLVYAVTEWNQNRYCTLKNAILNFQSSNIDMPKHFFTQCFENYFNRMKMSFPESKEKPPMFLQRILNAIDVSQTCQKIPVYWNVMLQLQSLCIISTLYSSLHRESIGCCHFYHNLHPSAYFDRK